LVAHYEVLVGDAAGERLRRHGIGPAGEPGGPGDRILLGFHLAMAPLPAPGFAWPVRPGGSILYGHRRCGYELLPCQWVAARPGCLDSLSRILYKRMP